LEAANLLVPEREIVTRGNRRFQLHLPARIIGKRIETLRGTVRCPNLIWIAMPLRQILGAAKAHSRHLMFAKIVLDREPFEGREGPHDEVDFVALGQFDCLGLRGRRYARSIGDDKLNLSARKRGILIL
jgi:hypothetical protein